MSNEPPDIFEIAKQIRHQEREGASPAPTETPTTETTDTPAKSPKAAKPKAAKTAKAPKAKAPAKPVRAVKRDEVLALLARKRGATVAQIAEATDGWQKHTIRAFISTVPRKLGLSVASEKNAKGERVYRTHKPEAEAQPAA